LAANDYGDIYIIIDKFGSKVNRDALLSKLHIGIKSKQIELLRHQHRELCYEKLRHQLTDTREHILKSLPNIRLEFASKFLMYQGLLQYYKDRQNRNESYFNAHQITGQSMDKYERDLMKIFNCD
jgi:hypothetical protein